jgi:hypothetical protein
MNLLISTEEEQQLEVVPHQQSNTKIMTTVKKLVLNVSDILSEYAEDHGIDKDDNYIDVLDSYSEACDTYDDNSLNDIVHYKKNTEEYLEGFFEYREDIKKTLYNLEDFQTEIQNNSVSFVDTDDFNYNYNRADCICESIYTSIKDVIKKRNLTAEVNVIHDEFYESLDREGDFNFDFDSSKFSPDALIIEKEIDWLSGNYIRYKNESYLKDWADYIIESSIDEEVLKAHIKSLKKHIDDINNFISIDYPEHVI